MNKIFCGSILLSNWNFRSKPRLLQTASPQIYDKANSVKFTSAYSLKSSTRKTFAVAFDVDGVLYRGSEPIKKAKQAIELLQEFRVPFIYLTNGGGLTEEEKAQLLAKRLNVKVRPCQVQLSHTPLRFLSKKHKEDLVLVVGKHNAQQLAELYDFQNIVTSDEYHAQHPELFPDEKPEPIERIPRFHEPVKACVVLSPPTHWYRDLQLLCDILRSDGHAKNIVSKQVVSCYVAGPDFEYVAETKTPRLGDGVFLKCLEHIYTLSTGHSLKTTVLGKPYSETYRCAELLLQKQASDLGYDSIHTIYAIGDNPITDIKGANAAGGHWVSMLVHTGMFQPSQDKDNCTENPASIVASDVYYAIAEILQIEGILGKCDNSLAPLF